MSEGLRGAELPAGSKHGAMKAKSFLARVSFTVPAAQTPNYTEGDISEAQGQPFSTGHGLFQRERLA